MTYYLRNKNNETVLDVELFKDAYNIDLRTVVCIKPYSKLLLDILKENKERGIHFIETFDGLQELRGWLWEVYFCGIDNDLKEFDNVKIELEKILKDVCSEYSELHIVND